MSWNLADEGRPKLTPSLGFLLTSNRNTVQGRKRLDENHHLRKLRFYNVAEMLASNKAGGGRKGETEGNRASTA